MRPKPADAYLVCGLDCPHEYMAKKATDVWSDGDINAFWNDIQSGITHEDGYDHVYGLNASLVLIGEPFLTATHFWNADLGEGAPAKNALPLGEFQNSLQKVRAYWSLALGAYADGDKGGAYHYLGHIIHHFGDNTVPAHVHDDPHGPEPFDDDSFHDWMDERGNPPPNAGVSSAEQATLVNAGPLPFPDDWAGDRLRFLLYSTNQVADFFASDDEDGDATAGGWDSDPAARDAVQADLDALNNSSVLRRLWDHGQLGDNDFGDDNDDGDLGIIREYSYLRGIRSIAAVYKLFEETVRQQVTLYVVVDRVQETQPHEGELCVPVPIPGIPPTIEIVCTSLGDPDFYARTSIGFLESRNRAVAGGDQATEDETDISPHWVFGNTVGTTGSVPVRLEIWDHDGAYDTPVNLSGSDQQSDVSHVAGDRGLDLTVDLGKCLRREAGAISGDVSGACGATLSDAGDFDDEASRVTFRVFASKSPPQAEAGGPYTTKEGTDVELSGTGSDDPDNDITTYAWDLDSDGDCDDVANDSTPNFSAVGNDGTTTVKLCVTDAVGLTSTDTATVTVTNEAPSLSASANAPKTENTTVTVTGTISDQGWLDGLSGTISWGDGTAVQPLVGTAENARPDATLAFSTSHTYGDDGTFTIQVCARDDDTNPCTSLSLRIDNTSPTAMINLSGAVSVNGTPTIIGRAGQAVAFTGRSTDPGSDDLTLAWTWGDGTPGSTTTSLVNPPDPDPAVSPSIQPRDVTSSQSHTFGGACAFETTFGASDDDGGTALQKANVIIVGNGRPNQPHGWWKQEFRFHATGKGSSDFTAAQITCYLKIAGYMSRVFDEKTAASTFAQAYDILDVSGTSNMYELFDLQLLAAWLNFANGAMAWDRLVDTNGDKVADARFLDAITAAETLRLNPNSTSQQLDRQKAIIESWTRLP